MIPADRARGSRLLALPPELRNHIYDYAIQCDLNRRSDIIDVLRVKQYYPSFILAHTCRKLREETYQAERDLQQTFWHVHTFSLKVIASEFTRFQAAFMSLLRAFTSAANIRSFDLAVDWPLEGRNGLEILFLTVLAYEDKHANRLGRRSRKDPIRFNEFWPIGTREHMKADRQGLDLVSILARTGRRFTKISLTGDNPPRMRFRDVGKLTRAMGDDVAWLK